MARIAAILAAWDEGDRLRSVLHSHATNIVGEPSGRQRLPDGRSLGRRRWSPGSVVREIQLVIKAAIPSGNFEMQDNGDLFGGLVILGLWGLMIGAIVTGLGSPALTGGLYIALLILVSMQYRLLQAFLGSLPLDGPVAWGLLLAVLSVLVVVAAPVVGGLKVIRGRRKGKSPCVRAIATKRIGKPTRSHQPQIAGSVVRSRTRAQQ